MVTKYLSGVAKKFASFDKDYLIVLVIFLLVLFSSKGFATVSAPEQNVSRYWDFAIRISMIPRVGHSIAPKAK